MALFKISSKIYGAWSVDVENDFINLNSDNELPAEINSNSRNNNGRNLVDSQINENETKR